MKHLKFFEGFEEQFDYNIEQIKDILNLRNVDFVDIDFIDSGAYGSAFDLNNGFVLKLTNMDSELYYAKKLISIDSNHIVKVKDVFFHKYYDIGYTVKVGFIIMEKLDTNKGYKFKNFVDMLNNYGTIKTIYKTISDNKVLEFFKDKIVSMNNELILSYWQIYKNILTECDRYKLPTDDLRGNNIGFRENTPIFFDIGDIHNSYKHDFSNIDVIEYNITIR